MLADKTAINHEIRIHLGIEPVNVKPYRLPETQKQDVRRQLEELRRGGIITGSNSPGIFPYSCRIRLTRQGEAVEVSC
jgi:hypothetical protein